VESCLHDLAFASSRSTFVRGCESVWEGFKKIKIRFWGFFQMAVIGRAKKEILENKHQLLPFGKFVE
jgi:hypothetical protein